MDKQTNIPVNTQNGIPVNTRTIGAPEGIYILYLEDYVHTFIKKILSENPQCTPPDSRHRKSQEEYQQEFQLDFQQDVQIEGNLPKELALYGRTIEEDGRYRIVISGAAVCDGSAGKIQQLNTTYFPSCAYIGNATVSLNKDSRMRLELTLRSTRVILDDFYIYYDQNEEMQNYLVEWNTTRENDKSRIILSPTGQGTPARSSATDAAHLSRITQAYNREEAKVSFMWNVMNVLCLGFVVCVMAYGIISMNNYNKMQNMQANIDYCMAFIEENTAFLLDTAKTAAGQSQSVQTMQQYVETEDEKNTDLQLDTTKKNEENTDLQLDIAKTDTEQPQSASTMQQVEAEGEKNTVPQLDAANTDIEQSQSVPAMQQVEAEGGASADDSGVEMETTLAAQEERTVPQYYVVRRGDTLRTISFDIYGDYSRVDEICKWNNIEDPNNILYGQKLLLP